MHVIWISSFWLDELLINYAWVFELLRRHIYFTFHGLTITTLTDRSLHCWLVYNGWTTERTVFLNSGKYTEKRNKRKSLKFLQWNQLFFVSQTICLVGTHYISNSMTKSFEFFLSFHLKRGKNSYRVATCVCNDCQWILSLSSSLILDILH